MKVILRRNNVGVPACSNLVIEDSVIVNKDRDPIPVADVVIRWGTTSSVPGNPKVFNTAKAIHRVFEKAKFRKVLSDEGIAPRSWVTFSDFLNDVGPDSPGWPYLVRPENHSRSKEMNVCSSVFDLAKVVVRLGQGRIDSGFYISEFIKKDQEFRVFMAQGRVVAIIEKIPTDRAAASWGCVDAGQFKYVTWNDWPIDVCKVCVKAFELSTLDFGAVDVIRKDGKSYVLEINTAPELTPYYGKRLGKAIDYMIEHPGLLPVENEQNWKSFAHPTLGE